MTILLQLLLQLLRLTMSNFDRINGVVSLLKLDWTIADVFACIDISAEIP